MRILSCFFFISISQHTKKKKIERKSCSCFYSLRRTRDLEFVEQISLVFPIAIRFHREVSSISLWKSLLQLFYDAHIFWIYPSPSSNLWTLPCLLIHSLIYSLCFWVSFLPSHVWTSYTHIGTMGPATAWENSQETWLQWRLQPSEISKLSEFTPGRSTYAPEKHRITISDSISQHRFTS